LNRLQVWPGQLLHTAVAPRLVPDGKRGRCRYYPPPSRSLSPDRGFRRFAAVRLARRGGQPVAVGVCFARPRITGIPQEPPLCVGALPVIRQSRRAHLPKKTIRAKVLNIVRLSRLINLGTWPTIWARHRLGIGARNHHMSPPSIAQLLRREPATMDPV